VHYGRRERRANFRGNPPIRANGAAAAGFRIAMDLQNRERIPRSDQWPNTTRRLRVTEQLRGKRVAALVDNGFEQSELLDPKKALEDAGARVDIVSPQNTTVKGWQHGNWGQTVQVDRELDEARADEYDALLLPGGVMNPDKLRMNPKAVAFVRTFVNAGKPIASICHGPWTLIEAGAVNGRKMTSWPSLQTDLKNAGARWVDEECVVDNGIVTSRKPDDIPAFNKKMIEEFAEGRHDRTTGSREFAGTHSGS
jgi:protease I